MFLTPPGMVSSRLFWRQFGVGQVPARYGSARVFLFLWTPFLMALIWRDSGTSLHVFGGHGAAHQTIVF